MKIILDYYCLLRPKKIVLIHRFAVKIYEITLYKIIAHSIWPIIVFKMGTRDK